MAQDGQGVVLGVGQGRSVGPEAPLATLLLGGQQWRRTGRHPPQAPQRPVELADEGDVTAERTAGEAAVHQGLHERRADLGRNRRWPAALRELVFDELGQLEGLVRVLAHRLDTENQDVGLAALLCGVPRGAGAEDRIEHLEQLVAQRAGP